MTVVKLVEIIIVVRKQNGEQRHKGACDITQNLVNSIPRKLFFVLIVLL